MIGKRVVQALSPVMTLAVAVAVAACSTGSSSAAAPSRGAIASVLPSISGTPPPQTDTEWGRIWDTLPAGFPTYPGATPGEETATGAASANLVVTGGDAKTIATALQASLTKAGYTTVGLSGPLEDGSYQLDMTGAAAGCKIQVQVTPTGGLTTVTILYGADCPHS